MALQFTKAPAALDLILSDVWCSSLFSPSAVKVFLKADKTERGTEARLKMSEDEMRKLKKKHIHCACSQKAFIDRSRSPIRLPMPFRTQQENNYGKGRNYTSKQPQGVPYLKTQNKSSSQNYSKPQQKGGGKSFPNKNISKKPNTSGGIGGPKKQQS